MDIFLIKKCTKKCPCCGSMIQKADGCNKMTCGRCRNYFCWICLKKIDSYDHFREGCTLWEGGKIDENLVDDRMKEATLTVEQLEQHLYDQAKNKLLLIADKWVIKCPACDELNARGTDNINLMQCTSCSRTFCFTCGKLIQGKQHFEESNCYYMALEDNTQQL